MIMRQKIELTLMAAALCLVSASEVRARGFGGFHAGGFGGGFGGFHGGGFGGFHAGGFGGFHGSSFHAGGFGGGFGSVHYSGFSHYGPATGFTHYGGATYAGVGGVAHTSNVTHAGWGNVEHYSGATAAGWGGAAHYGGWGAYHGGDAWGGYHAAATYHPYNYGSFAHYDAAAYHVPGVYGGWGHAVVGPAGYGAAVYHGPMGGTYAAYRGPFSAGAVASLPSGYTTVAWRGGTYYHYGYHFYNPTWYGGTVAYVPIYPPVGFFYASLPSDATPTVINNNTYYVSDGVYYQPSAQNGQQGYAVVESPSQSAGAQVLASTTGGGPDPLQLLQKLSNSMGNESHVIMKINETFDEVTAAGQKIQFTTERKIWLDRPDKLEVKVSGSGAKRRIVYNGSTFSIIDQIRNIYASVAISGSLDSALTQMAQQYGLAQPADELLYSNLYAQLSGKIQTGQYLGTDWVGSHNCQHLAFTQFGVNWEIWIEDGIKAIPRKLLVTYVAAQGRPQYSMTITDWDTPALMWGADFNFSPPSNATSASMVSLTGEAPPGQ